MFIRILPLLILSLTLLDLASKYWSVAVLRDSTVRILGDFVMFRLSHNTGIAFSMPLEGIGLKAVTIALIGGIIYYFIRHESHRHDRIIRTVYSLILAWAIGNGIERVFIGRVTDWIAVKYFAILNFADIFISVGAAVLILYYLVHEYRNPKSDR